MEELKKKISIREAKKEDIKEIERIEQAITKHRIKTDFSNVIKDSSDIIALVAELNGKIVGYMISYIIYGGFGVDRGAWIANFGVDPRYMGQGIGRSLASVLFEICKEKGIKFLYTSVRWDSVDILSFFKTVGFDRSDFINLEKRLS